MMYITLVVCGCHNKQACCVVELMYIIYVDDVHHPGDLCLLLHCHRESDKHGDVDDVHHPGGL
jgi:hypothetical protein